MALQNSKTRYVLFIIIIIIYIAQISICIRSHAKEKSTDIISMTVARLLGGGGGGGGSQTILRNVEPDE